jgi:PAS domain S-box-containing protein
MLMSDVAPEYETTTPFGSRYWRLIVLGMGGAAVLSLASLLLAPASTPVGVKALIFVIVPAGIGAMIVASRGRRADCLLASSILLDAQAVLLSAVFVVGLAYAVLLPFVGLALLLGVARGRWLGIAFALAGASSVVGVAIALTVGPLANVPKMSPPVVGVLGCALLVSFGLGHVWRINGRREAALWAARREIAVRAAAETELARTSGLLGAIVHSSPVATIALDADRTVRVWSPAAERIYGWTADEVVGKPLPMEMIPEEDRASSAEWLARVLEGSVAQGVRARHLTKDGREIQVEVHGATLRDHDGRPTGAAGQLIDVTERVTLESQLREAHKMEAVGRLAGGIGHDINNTLTAVGGFASLIADRATDPEIREDALAIQGAAERAHNMTRQLLAFARRSALQTEIVEINAFLAAVEPLFRRLVREDVEFVVSRRVGSAWMQVDPGQLEHALLNLVGNAQDAMPRGGRLEMSVRREPSAAGDAVQADPDVRSVTGTEVAIAISDTGTGIPPELQPRVFEPFFTTKGVGEGTGLGLAMVYGFVTQSHGKVALHSIEGRGTTVEIRLPEVARPSDAAVVPSPRANRQGLGETILFVEDEPSVAAFGARALSDLGYHVLPAGNGQAAVEVAHEHRGPIDLLLTDVVMPGMSGPELAAIVRAAHPETALLFMSGYAGDVIADRAVLGQEATLIEKPYTKLVLAASVRAALAVRRSADEEAG